MGNCLTLDRKKGGGGPPNNDDNNGINHNHHHQSRPSQVDFSSNPPPVHLLKPNQTNQTNQPDLPDQLDKSVTRPFPIRLSLSETSPLKPLSYVGDPKSMPSSPPLHTPPPPLEHLKQAIHPLTLDGCVCIGFCSKAYDGDTCTINVRSQFGDHQWKVRLLGFDSPEMKTKNLIEKKHAIACRNTLLDLIGQKFVVISCGPFEKYGRLLGNVYVRSSSGSLDDGDDIQTQSCEAMDVEKIGELLHVNDWMTKNTSSVPYDGGKKQDMNFDRKFHTIYMKHVR
jgi:hypothetical protein